MKPRLIVMVKEPRPGRVKTRLGKDFGYVKAAHWYRNQTLQTLKRLSDPRWELVLAVSPDSLALQKTIWPSHIKRLAQGTGNLGARMSRLLRHSAPQKTCIIGSDIPGLNRAQISEAFAGLGSHSAVVGPATDGGYWLIGLRHPAHQPARFLEGVRWSTQHALADSLHSGKGLHWKRISTMPDVDTLDDLRTLKARS